MGKTAKGRDNVAMLDRVAQLFLAERCSERDAAVLIGQSFRMHEGQIEKRPQRHVGRLVEAARDRAVGDGAGQRIGRERPHAAAEHVAGKLVEQNDEGEGALRRVLEEPRVRRAPLLRAAPKTAT